MGVCGSRRRPEGTATNPIDEVMDILLGTSRQDEALVMNRTPDFARADFSGALAFRGDENDQLSNNSVVLDRQRALVISHRWATRSARSADIRGTRLETAQPSLELLTSRISTFLTTALTLTSRRMHLACAPGRRRHFVH